MNRHKPYGLCPYGRRTSRDERGRVAVTNCPSRSLSLDEDGYFGNVGRPRPCPQGSAWLRVEPKGRGWRSRCSTGETIERWWREGRQPLRASQRASWRFNILEQGEHLPRPKEAGLYDGSSHREERGRAVSSETGMHWFGGGSGGNTPWETRKVRRCSYPTFE